MDPLTASSGWGVLHLFLRFDRGRFEGDPAAGDHFADAVRSLEEDGHQAICFVVVGHKADLGVMAIGPDLARLSSFERSLRSGPLEPTWSYLSITELSPYRATEQDERGRLERDGVTGEALEAGLVSWRARSESYERDRLYPVLPSRRIVCFYPMAKRRLPGANWYELPFAQRKELMTGHGAVGRRYAGRILQLVTASAGLDNWEWGVTLLADDLAAVKEIVAEMRYDPGSARYGEFGPFVVGLVGDPRAVWAGALGRSEGAGDGGALPDGGSDPGWGGGRDPGRDG